MFLVNRDCKNSVKIVIVEIHGSEKYGSNTQGSFTVSLRRPECTYSRSQAYTAICFQYYYRLMLLTSLKRRVVLHFSGLPVGSSVDKITALILCKLILVPLEDDLITPYYPPIYLVLEFLLKQSSRQ